MAIKQPPSSMSDEELHARHLDETTRVGDRSILWGFVIVAVLCIVGLAVGIPRASGPQYFAPVGNSTGNRAVLPSNTSNNVALPPQPTQAEINH